MNRQHAYVIEAGAEEGIEIAQKYASEELGIRNKGNADWIELRYGLLSVEDSRRVQELAVQAPIKSDKKALAIAANRAYHEAQNALLKLFEEPPEGTYLFLIVPTAGMLLPTLRSRVQILENPKKKNTIIYDSDGIAAEFIKGSKEKRTALIKKLTSGRDEEERRENREAALAIVNGIEAVAYRDVVRPTADVGRSTSYIWALLKELQVLRGYLHDRSAPVKMILEHLSLVLPRNLLS